ncbi:hypothetical protein BN2475_140007 [Paraburkholderia ribeironis]|uniref:Uncharacterized protein n=1 Tax=Paraburkholderia ribeironis TaxID=1247936 RepID=A0A1N7RSN9_9BURK|nr:hypothetical protein BN2475_140007 [Paraburkholderia ribeironis]
MAFLRPGGGCTKGISGTSELDMPIGLITLTGPTHMKSQSAAWGAQGICMQVGRARAGNRPRVPTGVP